VDRLTKVLVSFFGLGYAPFASGTWGTAGAVLVAWLLPAGDLWPVRRLEAIGGGTGILLDDLAAGVFGLILLTVVRFATGWTGAL
jgi:phosphatidylglycerophosphatase A